MGAAENNGSQHQADLHPCILHVVSSRHWLIRRNSSRSAYAKGPRISALSSGSKICGGEFPVVAGSVVESAHFMQVGLKLYRLIGVSLLSLKTSQRLRYRSTSRNG